MHGALLGAFVGRPAMGLHAKPSDNRWALTEAPAKVVPEVPIANPSEKPPPTPRCACPGRATPLYLGPPAAGRVAWHARAPAAVANAATAHAVGFA